MQLLLNADPDCIDISNNELETPLHILCNKQKRVYVELLVNAGSDLDVQDYAGDTPLHIAAMNADYKCLEILLFAGADASLTNDSKYTPLHLAVMSKCKICIKLILQFICAEDINRQSIYGTTALMIAAQHDNKNIVQMLLLKGANPHIPDHDGRLPLHFANAALEPLLNSMDVNSILTLSYQKFNFNCDIKNTRLFEKRPEIFALFAVDYLWQFWTADKNHCILIIQVLLSHLSLNYDFQYSNLPKFNLYHPTDFVKLLEIAEMFGVYGQDFSILWHDINIINPHSICIEVEIPIEIWALRALSTVSPLYSPYYILKRNKGKKWNKLSLPETWELEFVDDTLTPKFFSLKHLSRCVIRRLFCNLGFVSYNKFQQKLKELDLPTCLSLYIQYMEGINK